MKTVALTLFFLLLAQPSARALNEEFVIPREEPQSVYTRPWNWCDPGRGPWYSTTRYDTDGEPRLDESRLPDGTYCGTATAAFTGLLPGTYEVWVYYRLSENRSYHVPWSITTDGEGLNAMEGFTNQYDPTGDPVGDWFLIPETRETPLEAQGALTLVWSVQDPGERGFDGRSVSYGGVRLVRIGLLKVAAPVIAPPGGTFEGSVEVALTTSTPGAGIRYTLDGSVPGPSSPLYAGPFTLASSATVRAQAFRIEMTDSDVSSADFTVTAPEGGPDETAAEAADVAEDRLETDLAPDRPDTAAEDGLPDEDGTTGMQSGCGCLLLR